MHHILGKLCIILRIKLLNVSVLLSQHTRVCCNWLFRFVSFHYVTGLHSRALLMH